MLVSPRNPLNIGAAARAMANFGFARLAVVAPYEPHWREAQSAVGAQKILRNARLCATLHEALADCTLVLGTGTVTHRKPEQPVILLPQLADLIRSEIGRSRSAPRIALVFGPEKRGLTRDHLALCRRMIVIPTAPSQPSMNLGQAVAVCLYELAARIASPATESGLTDLAPKFREAAPDNHSPATAAQLDRLAGVIEETMQAAHRSAPHRHAANRRDLDLLLRRLALGASDATRILGLFRRILWRLCR